MRGQWIPEHLSINIEPHKADALLKLLREVRQDDGFPLNEMEEEVVDELVTLLEEREDGAGHTVGAS